MAKQGPWPIAITRSLRRIRMDRERIESGEYIADRYCDPAGRLSRTRRTTVGINSAKSMSLGKRPAPFIIVSESLRLEQVGGMWVPEISGCPYSSRISCSWFKIFRIVSLHFFPYSQTRKFVSTVPPPVPLSLLPAAHPELRPPPSKKK